MSFTNSLESMLEWHPPKDISIRIVLYQPMSTTAGTVSIFDSELHIFILIFLTLRICSVIVTTAP